MSKTEQLGGDKKICPVCGKEFYATVDWVFKKDIKKGKHIKKYICSWKCIRRLENGESIRMVS